MLSHRLPGLGLSLLVLFLLLTGMELRGQLLEKIVPMNRMFYGTPAPGWMFITPIPLDTADYPAALAILDEQGNPVFYNPITSQTSGPYQPVLVTDFKVQPSGLMSFGIPRNPGDMVIYLLDSGFVIVDSITTVNDVETDSHDFIHLPDGTYHLVGTEERIMDCSGLLTDEGIPGSVNATVVGNVIQRFNPDKSLAFEWRSLDYFDLEDVYSQYFTNPNYLDHSHYNSLDIDSDGHYLLSFRHLNEITKVHSSTGEIIWRLGGKAGMFTFEGDTMPFSAQHDARRIPNGNLTLFDNGLYNSTPRARALEYQLNTDDFTATAVWQYAEPNGLPSVFIGSTRRFSNGNTLIDWGGAFPLSQSTSFTEVDPQGNVVMEIDFVSDLFVSYRAIKNELPFVLPRPVLECDNENKTLTAPAGYTFYEWNTGANTQSVVVQDTGTYQVWVNQGIGYICSEPFYVEDLENLCGTLNTPETPAMSWKIYPNPAADKLFFQSSGPAQSTAVQLYNQFGQKVLSLDPVQDHIDVSGLHPGLYTLEIISGREKSFHKVVLSR